MCTLIHTGCECIKSPIVLSCRQLSGQGLSAQMHKQTILGLANLAPTSKMIRHFTFDTSLLYSFIH